MSEFDLGVACWRTSTYSSGQGTECVEVAAVGRGVAARDSKDPGGVVLGFSRGAWAAFLDGVKAGRFQPAP